MLSRFFLTSSNTDGMLQSALGFVSMHSAASSMCAVTKFSYPSFRVCVSHISEKVSNLFITVTVHSLLISLLVSENKS